MKSGSPATSQFPPSPSSSSSLPLPLSSFGWHCRCPDLDKGAYRFIKATMKRRATEFWAQLSAASDLKEYILNDVRTKKLTMIPWFVDLFKTEFVGRSIHEKDNKYAKEQTGVALTKLHSTILSIDIFYSIVPNILRRLLRIEKSLHN